MGFSVLGTIFARILINPEGAFWLKVESPTPKFAGMWSQAAPPVLSGSMPRTSSRATTTSVKVYVRPIDFERILEFHSWFRPNPFAGRPALVGVWSSFGLGNC